MWCPSIVRSYTLFGTRQLTASVFIVSTSIGLFNIFGGTIFALSHQRVKLDSLLSLYIPQPSLARRIWPIKSAPTSRPVSPDSDDHDSVTSRIMKISFRKGGDKAFYAVLKRSLKNITIKANGIGTSSRNVESISASNQRVIGRSGITGILKTVETTAQGRRTGMQDALQDLEALMIKAKDMVRIAAELNEKLTAASSSASNSNSAPEPEEATFIRSSLSQLGLQMPNAPVTLDMIKDESLWFDELARELAQVLQGSSSNERGKLKDAGGMMKARGVVALDEVWGGWNRARGVALIPPATFLLVLPQLPQHTNPPINVRMLASGLRVLHTPQFTHAAFSARLSGLLALTGPRTAWQVAQEEGIALGLAVEMITAVEGDGDICRDDPGAAIVGGGGEVSWWANLFVGYVWDGQF
ncbi:hypothetical protein H0H81_011879 [Sphagnurus paluster]|uniref:Vacuolar protein-sorting-associated protein 36 n=1 Tax=Sphagnurus paluster TaxID=117069 RepID=A0A9P7KKE6_9AGAR|nr:hypothetical protein H0H81_011879 [Sphagnurus paluster]